MLIIGVGHPLRGDDAVGPRAAELLAKQGFETRILDGEGARLIDAWQDRNTVVVIDALSSGAAPGTIKIIDAIAEKVPPGLFRYSSHAFGLAEAIETSRAFGNLPTRLTIFGIEGMDFSLGSPICGAVEDALVHVIERIAKNGTRMEF